MPNTYLFQVPQLEISQFHFKNAKIDMIVQKTRMMRVSKHLFFVKNKKIFIQYLKKLKRLLKSKPNIQTNLQEMVCKFKTIPKFLIHLKRINSKLVKI